MITAYTDPEATQGNSMAEEIGESIKIKLGLYSYEEE